MQVPEYKNQEDYHEQRRNMPEYNMETLKYETQLCKKTSGTFPG